MSEPARTASQRLLAIVAAGFLCAGAAVAPASAQGTAKDDAPNFNPGDTGWVTIGVDWTSVPGGPQPTGCDPARPCVGNNTGKQPTFKVADAGNPNLTQFAKDSLKKSNEEVLRGKAMYAREARCWPTGVPAFLLNPGGPSYWLQTPEKIAIIWQLDHQVRHIYLNVPHSANPKPSWYGESVGRYEGDTLVVDTVGQNAETFVDNYRTPHSDKLHVVERYRIVSDGKTLEAQVTMEDPAVFLKPLQVVHRWRRMQGALIESTCAEGEISNPFHQDVEPIPRANKPDF
jgi:hypothetical protein